MLNENEQQRFKSTTALAINVRPPAPAPCVRCWRRTRRHTGRQQQQQLILIARTVKQKYSSTTSEVLRTSVYDYYLW